MAHLADGLFGRSGQQQAVCYRMELETCFRTAFMTMHGAREWGRRRRSADRNVTGAEEEEERERRELRIFEAPSAESAQDQQQLPQQPQDHQHSSAAYDATSSVFDRMLQPGGGKRQLIFCNELRRFSTCFGQPGCSDRYAAQIAATQYHMVFGRKFPVQVFLAYRGFGRHTCERQFCSHHTRYACGAKLSEASRQNDQRLLVEALELAHRIDQSLSQAEAESAAAAAASSSKVELIARQPRPICDRLGRVIERVLKLRLDECGDDAARCFCFETQLQNALATCEIPCERILSRVASAAAPSFSSFVAIVLTLIFLLN